MSEPGDPMPERRTDRLPSASRGARDPTTPLPTPQPAGPSRTPPSPTRWVVIAAVVVAGAFLLGFLLGRIGDGSQPEGPQGPPVCRRAATLATRLLALHRQAVANRMEFAEAVARGDRDRMEELNAELEELSAEGEPIEERAQRVLDRCRS